MTKNEENDLGADATEVDSAGQAVHADAAPHVEALKHLLDVAAYQTCNLDHYTTALNVLKGLESGSLLLVSRANAEAALNDARCWGQWYEFKGSNSSEAKGLQRRARVMLGLETSSELQAGAKAGTQEHAVSTSASASAENNTFDPDRS